MIMNYIFSNEESLKSSLMQSLDRLIGLSILERLRSFDSFFGRQAVPQIVCFDLQHPESNDIASYMIGDYELLNNHKSNNLTNKEEDQDIVIPTTVITEQQLLQYFGERRFERAKDGSLIGGRVNNGRTAEDRLCELLTDDNAWQLACDCHKKFLGYDICVSSNLKMFLCSFIWAFYKKLNKYYETAANKLSHFHRLAESKLGALVGCGLRTLEKGYNWLMEGVASLSENDYWQEKGKEKLAMWNNLKDKISEYLTTKLALVSVSTPH